MSLKSMIKSKEHRELFKPIASPKQMFHSLTQEPPSAKGQPRVPSHYRASNPGLIGVAFDYLLRAQVARWNGDSWERTVPWGVTRNLEMALFTSTWSDSVTPGFFSPSLDLLDELGRLIPDAVEAYLDERFSGTDRETSMQRQLCDRYQEVYELWVRFISGRAESVQEVIAAVWFIARLDSARLGYTIRDSGGVFGAVFGNRVDMEVLLEDIPSGALCEIEALWNVLEEHRKFFVSSTSRVYGPSFGCATEILVGASADLLVDTTLIELKTTAKGHYNWMDAAQLVSYYVLAAMAGEPWPIERLAIYRPRFGRLDYVDCAEVKESMDLLGFARNLLEIRAPSSRADFMPQESKLGIAVTPAAIEEYERRRAVLLENARKHLG